MERSGGRKYSASLTADKRRKAGLVYILQPRLNYECDSTGRVPVTPSIIPVRWLS